MDRACRLALDQLHDAALELWAQRLAGAVLGQDRDVRALRVQVGRDPAGRPRAALLELTTSSGDELTMPADREIVLAPAQPVDVSAAPVTAGDLAQLVCEHFARAAPLHARTAGQRAWTIDLAERDPTSQYQRELNAGGRVRDLQLHALTCLLRCERARTGAQTVTITRPARDGLARVICLSATGEVHDAHRDTTNVIFALRLAEALYLDQRLHVSAAGAQLSAPDGTGVIF